MAGVNASEREPVVAEMYRRAITLARQIGIFLACGLSANSLTATARCFGGRDHATVIHSIRQIERLLETDTQLAADIAALRQQLR
jgi:chromosomal replication initiator protein